MNPMNRELTNASRRAAEARVHLDLQRDRVRTLRAGRYDAKAAEAVFRTIKRTMETFEEDRFQLEAELVMAKAGSWSRSASI
jgi:hypothetical protein